MQCPRDSATLLIEHHKGIEVDHCPTCNGRWLDHHELDELEARTAPDENQRRATIEYAKRPSDLNCPVCGKQMRAFNYRAYNLELDTCEDQHGFWVDAGRGGPHPRRDGGARAWPQPRRLRRGVVGGLPRRRQRQVPLGPDRRSLPRGPAAS